MRYIPVTESRLSHKWVHRAVSSSRMRIASFAGSSATCGSILGYSASIAVGLRAPPARTDGAGTRSLNTAKCVRAARASLRASGSRTRNCYLLAPN